jgi:hypothetical protein
MSEFGGIIVPSAELVAVVRHAALPPAPPEDLLPYVRSTPIGDEIDDWLLSEDTLAFADVTIPTQFELWRNSWERSWVLDPVSSLERLVSAAAEFEVSAPETTLLERVLEPAAFGTDGGSVHTELDPDEAARLAAVIESLRDAVADRGRTGFGFVDATPGRRRIGLARSWSGQDGPEVLVADASLSVSIDADHGLTVTLAPGPDDDEAHSIVGVVEVEIVDDRVEARSDAETLAIDLHRGRVLSWLLPGCTLWRVRRVPEVIVWARTFAGIHEAAEYAVALDRPVRLTSLRLSESDSSSRFESAPRPRRLESRIDQEG